MKQSFELTGLACGACVNSVQKTLEQHKDQLTILHLDKNTLEIEVVEELDKATMQGFLGTDGPYRVV